MKNYLIILIIFLAIGIINYDLESVTLSHSNSVNTSVKLFNSKPSSLEFRTVEADSSVNNIIEKVYNNGELYTVEIQLNDYDNQIRILVFNMLGNLVKSVFEGNPLTENSVYQFDASNLPNGVYLCILEGPNFRDAEKFIISR